MQAQQERTRERGSWVCVAVVAFALTAFGNGAQRPLVGAGGRLALAQAPTIPHRSAPALLSKQDVPAGLAQRLQRMRDRCAAYQARRSGAQRRRGRSYRAINIDRDPPREPNPATPPHTLEP